jgi:nucleoside-diphosphate kinase
MSFADVTTYGFTAEWYSPQSQLTNKYELTLYVPKKSGEAVEVSIFDLGSKRLFLKRSPQPDLRVEDFFIGGTVTIFSRQMRLSGYLDEHTRSSLGVARDCLCLLTAPEVFSHLGSLLTSVSGAGLAVTRLRLVNDNGPRVALQVTGQQAETKWNELANSLPEGCASKISDAQAQEYLDAKGRFPCTAVFDNCTLGVVRPHAVKAGSCGEIITAIMEANFEISALRMVHLSRTQAAEAFEVYKGVLPHYSAMVDEMSAAPCLAMEIRKGGRVVEDFRSLCGPLEVEMANHLRPKTLRARFGKDSVQNAVHATDLEGDAEMEVRYFFELLD